ncbi:MAG: polysaccharide deacetylase family protein [Clostridia bacterium]|nr:polysaccharide deacetylase family protein [Clostridia bacterium]
MRKSHLIALFILFIAVTVLIVSQAFTGPESEEILNVPSKGPATATPTATAPAATATPTEAPAPTQGIVARPDVDYTQFYNLSSQYHTAWSSTTMETMDVIKDTTCFYTKADNQGLDLYLTFTLEWPHKEAEILDVLKSHGAKATFFVSTTYLQNNPQTGKTILKRIIEEGHVLGVRGNFATATITPEKFCDELWAMEEIYQELTDHTQRMTYFRPSPDKISQRDIAIAEAMGYKVALWSGTFGGTSAVLLKDMGENMADGKIFALDTSDSVYTALTSFIPQAAGQGCSFKTLDQ